MSMKRTNAFICTVTVSAAVLCSSAYAGSFSALAPGGIRGDDQLSVIYDALSGEVAVEAPTGVTLGLFQVDSIAGIFTGDPPMTHAITEVDDPDHTLFDASFRGFTSWSYGNVAEPELAEDFLLGDLSVRYTTFGGGDGWVEGGDLIYVPEPSALILVATGTVTIGLCARRK